MVPRKPRQTNDPQNLETTQVHTNQLQVRILSFVVSTCFDVIEHLLLQLLYISFGLCLGCSTGASDFLHEQASFQHFLFSFDLAEGSRGTHRTIEQSEPHPLPVFLLTGPGLASQFQDSPIRNGSTLHRWHRVQTTSRHKSSQRHRAQSPRFPGS
jgi:hypothetical protein